MSKSFRNETFRIDGVKRPAGLPGVLDVTARIMRRGVLKYQEGSKTYRELKSDSAIFSKKAMKSAGGIPVTVGHGFGEITPATWGAAAVGFSLSDVRQDGDYLACTLRLTDPATIAAVESGALQEVSAGYWAKSDDAPGITEDGQRYDCVQVGCRLNHVALLPKGGGRAGPDCRLVMDGKDVGGYREDYEGEIMSSERADGLIKAYAGHMAEHKMHSDAGRHDDARKAANRAYGVALEGGDRGAARDALHASAEALMSHAGLEDEDDDDEKPSASGPAAKSAPRVALPLPAKEKADAYKSDAADAEMRFRQRAVNGWRTPTSTPTPSLASPKARSDARAQGAWVAARREVADPSELAAAARMQAIAEKAWEQ